MSRVSTQIEKKSEVSEMIIDAAERLLKSYGYQKMTMTDLAAEAGIGVGTTYLHFGGKAEVVLAVADRGQREEMLMIQAIADSPADPAQKIRDILWMRIKQRYDRCREIVRNTSWQQFHRHGPEFMSDIKTADPLRLQSWRDEQRNVISRIIASGIENSVFVTVDPDLTAETLLSATSGFMPSALDQEDFANPERFEDSVLRVISLLINGLRVDRSTNIVSKTE